MNKFMKIINSLLLFLLIFSSFSLLYSKNIPYIRGVHYFGNASPLNFWNSNEIEYADKDFGQIKKDGFNTVILLVPWGEFQYDIENGSIDKNLIKQLQNYIKIARKNGLYVILRLSYFWDLRKNTIGLNERILRLVTDEKTEKNWQKYLKTIYDKVSGYDNFLFGFLSWEDFQILFYIDSIKYYQNFYQKYFLMFKRFLIKKYKLEKYNIPKFNDPDYKFYLDFLDCLLMNKIFMSAKEVFPDLTFEARVDYDPIFSNGKINSWFVHKLTFNPPGSNIATVYYAPFMAQKNIGDEIGYKEAIYKLKILLKEFKKNANNRKLFIDQFNFISDVAALPNNTKIKNQDVNMFLSKAGEILLENTTGYALWAYKNYNLSIVYNSNFEKGFSGWRSYGNVKIKKSGNDYFSEIKEKGAISQKISEIIYKRNLVKNVPPIFCVVGFSECNKSLLEIAFSNSGFKKQISFNGKLKKYCFQVPYQTKSPEIKISSKYGTIFVDGIEFYNQTDHSGLYKENGKKSYFYDTVKKLNYLSVKTNVLKIENQFSDKWIGKTAVIKIFSKKNKIKIHLNIYNPSYIKRKIVLSLFYKNRKIREIKIKKGLHGYHFELQVEPDIVNSIKIVSNYTFIPHKNSDKRELSVLIKNIAVE